ncbi:hypothetical protein AAL_04495 [Moelleriella libera RCEF 2490]|uniref:Uncharacterized protein n=1 Tax=Moelleriella libera RCEF 2490 TaxID=1081109 RepID=A0A168BG36_9HYPO|nr:hypothetical protein AAL_04495 [Moelleriella libera RCEF 2490]
MLDENLPTYRLQPSSDEPLNTVLYFSHRGSEPSPDYLLQRGDARGQYALGLTDVHHRSVVYAEVLVVPEWTQPTLSAAELRNNTTTTTITPNNNNHKHNGSSGSNSNGAGSGSGAAASVALVPEAFTILLYNPDQSVVVKRNQSTWGISETWDFEVPSQSFKPPTASEIDKNLGLGGPAIGEPRVLFRWKRDGRLSKDMTCYMCGRREGGKRSKEPDITVALYRSGKTLTVYEPNMARVEVQDRKGLELVLLLSAEVVRDMYIVPRQDLFNTAAAEAQRAQREQRDAREQRRIRDMLDQEDQERRRQVDLETERLRKEYGVQQPQPQSPPHKQPPSTVRPSSAEPSPPGRKKHTLGGFFHRHDDDKKRSF